MRRRPRTVTLGDPGRRLHVGLLVVVLMLSLLGGRLLQLQAVDASAYALAATNERLTTVTLPAHRGSLLDAHGVPLAETVAAVDVTVDQTMIDDPRSTARKLAPLLRRDVDEIAKALSGDQRFGYVARGVSARRWRQIERRNLLGIFSEPAPQRVYPAHAVGGNVVGFVGDDGHGLAGLELAYDDVLAGVEGTLRYERGLDDERLPLGTVEDIQPRPGSDLRLTIDRDIQWRAQQALAAMVERSGARSGNLVAMDVETGAVLAMATAPTVDPNDPGGVAAEDRGNRPVEEAYEPGSVMKVLTAAALVEAGVVTPRTVFTVPDSLMRSGLLISDHSPHETARYTFAGIIAESSNVGTMLAAQRLDKDRLRQYFVDFGLGQPSGLDLPGETRGILPEAWSDLTRDTIVFGQGVAVTTLQMASAYATVAGGGVRMPPRLVDAVVAPDGSEQPVDYGEPRRVVSERTARTVRLLMEQVMGEGGTGSEIDIPGYRLAGKTGTAERVDDDCGCYRGYTASFMGFAPADDPKVVIAVSIQDPLNGYYGGVLAGPVWQQVMSFALQRLQVPPTGSRAPALPLHAR